MQAVAELAERLALGYYAQIAILDIAGRAEASKLMPTTRPGFVVPVGFVRRKDGTEHAFHFEAFLNMQRTDTRMVEDFKRVWPTGALLALGDALAAEKYFDHAPVLEMVYHLRNGVAHGNRFDIRDLKRLKRFPATTRDADIKSDAGTVFEITPGLNGKEVLFTFMEPGDVQDLLMSVGMYLRKLIQPKA
jgi:hypothetical protein